jgi:hypothetical protein
MMALSPRQEREAKLRAQEHVAQVELNPIRSEREREFANLLSFLQPGVKRKPTRLNVFIAILKYYREHRSMLRG